MARKSTLRRQRIRVGIAAAVITLVAGCGQETATALTPSDLGLGAAALVASGGQDPTAAIDEKTGTIHVVWAQSNKTAAADQHHQHHQHHGGAGDEDKLVVYLASSTDGGVSFSPPTRVSPADSDISAHSGGPPQVAVGKNGEILVAWELERSSPGIADGRTDILLSRSTDGGTTFDAARTVVQGEGVVSTSYFDLFVGDGGRVWIGFLDYRREFGGQQNQPVEVRVVHSDDAGATFSRSVAVHELACECCRVDFTTQGEKLLLGWRQIYPHGAYPGPQDPVRDVVLARSLDRGERWAAPVKLHDDNWVINQCPHSGPVLDTDSKGTLHTSWYSGSVDRPGIYYASSQPGEDALGAPRALFDQGVNPAPVPSLAIDSADRTWVSWESKSQVHAVRIQPDGSIDKLAGPIAVGNVPRVASGANRVVLVWAGPDGIRTLTGDVATGQQ